MTYEGSLYWSNYDSVKDTIEYELRMKIYSLIELEISGAVSEGLPQTHIDGMDRIKTLVLNMQNKTVDTASQPTLL